MTDFWPTAWTALAEARAPDAALSAATAAALARDWPVQRYVFEHKRAPNVERFELLREAGVFGHPPGLEHVEGGLRATGWPAMAYLSRAARRHPASVAEILATLESDNWRVISDGLGVASRLHRTFRAEPILHMLDLWQRAPIKWVQPRPAALALASLAQIDDSERALEAALTSVTVVLLGEGRNSADFEEVLSGVFDELGVEHYDALMTGIETALSMPSMRSIGGYRYERRGLRHVSRGSSDSLDSTLALWTRMLDARSADGHTAELLLGRAVRLLAAEPVLLRQMGIVALGAALIAKPDAGVASRVFNQWVAQAGSDWLTESALSPEILELLRAHQRALSTESMAGLLNLALEWANSEEREQWRAWYLLGALRPSLGARERLVLAGLEADRGVSTGRLDPMRAEAGWVRERSAIPPEDLAQMSPQEIVDATRFVPSIDDDEVFSSGATVSGFAQALKAQFLDRPDELVPVAADIAGRARDAVVVQQVAWAIRELFAGAASDDHRHHADVLRFVDAMQDQIRAARFVQSAELRSLESALADLLESLCEWLDSDLGDGSSILLSSLELLLESVDPTPNETDDDPLARAVNSVRGTGALAALRLASTRHRRGGDVVQLLELLRDHIAREEDIGVASAYGRYLAPLALYWPEFLGATRDRLLPTSEALASRWRAVFLTYLAFNSPHVEVAPRLVDEYARAVGDLARPDAAGYSSEQVTRLIGHLSGLALPGSPDDPVWGELLGRALSVAPADGVAQVIRELAFAIRREGLEVPDGWLLDLAYTQIGLLGQRPSSEVELISGAWVELLLFARVPFAAAAGALLSLVGMGGAIEEDELVEYLTVADRPRSRMGALLLRDATGRGAFDGYIRDEPSLRRLVGQYARSHPDLGWEMVNSLGRAGLFHYERLARSLIPESDKSPS